jgi:hypothetical protein
MTTTVLVSSPSPRVSVETSTHVLGEAIATMAARIHAATYELLVMLREFDAREGWNTGFLSCAHWLLGEAQRAPRAANLTDEITPGQRRADALGLLAEAALAADLDRGSAGDRYQVTLHVEMPTGVAAGEGLSGAVALDYGAVDVSAETSARLACDASIVRLEHAGDGTILDVGRRSRAVPSAIRRALTARDRTCRFPGCTSRFCDAHHIVHWIDGGGTSLDNFMLLCRRHHRFVHEGGFSIAHRDDDAFTFVRPAGTVFDNSTSLPEIEPDGLTSLAVADIPVWDGTPLDSVWALDVLYCPTTDRTAPAPA